MTAGVQTISPDVAAGEAWEIMRRNRIHHLVVTRAGEVVGVLSDRDTGGRSGTAVRTARTAADLMTGRVVTVDPTTTVRKAANLMRGRSIGCLVVTDRRRVKGIITVSDLLELIGRGVERPVAETRRPTLHHRTPHQKRHTAYGVW